MTPRTTSQIHFVQSPVFSKHGWRSQTIAIKVATCRQGRPQPPNALRRVSGAPATPGPRHRLSAASKSNEQMTYLFFWNNPRLLAIAGTVDETNSTSPSIANFNKTGILDKILFVADSNGTSYWESTRNTPYTWPKDAVNTRLMTLQKRITIHHAHNNDANKLRT